MLSINKLMIFAAMPFALLLAMSIYFREIDPAFSTNLLSMVLLSSIVIGVVMIGYSGYLKARSGQVDSGKTILYRLMSRKEKKVYDERH